MVTIQIIELDGCAVALIVEDRLIIPERLVGADRRRVQAKALYALEIRAGQRPGPYTDEDAERYAKAVTARRAGRRPHHE
jgi:hypothetical protein